MWARTLIDCLIPLMTDGERINPGMDCPAWYWGKYSWMWNKKEGLLAMMWWEGRPRIYEDRGEGSGYKVLIFSVTLVWVLLLVWVSGWMFQIELRMPKEVSGGMIYWDDSFYIYPVCIYWLSRKHFYCTLFYLFSPNEFIPLRGIPRGRTFLENTHSTS